jgi:hypothetical protein
MWREVTNWWGRQNPPVTSDPDYSAAVQTRLHPFQPELFADSVGVRNADGVSWQDSFA